MDFGEVVRVKSKFTILHCPALLWHALYSSVLYKMPCVHRTSVLLLLLLYECSVTIVLLSGANEWRHYPLPENNRWTKSLTQQCLPWTELLHNHTQFYQPCGLVEDRSVGIIGLP